MKKNILYGFFLLLIASCQVKFKRGSGKLITETKSVANFNKVSTSSNIDVIITQGLSFEVVVEADDNIMKYVVVTVDNNTLKIGLAHNTSFSNSHIKVKVTAPEYVALAASSSSSIKSIGVIQVKENLKIDANSSANVNCNVNGNTVLVSVHSSANIDLKGSIQNLVAETSSSADLNAFDLICENASAKANSSGTINVTVNHTLIANASSSGNVNYKGAAKVTQSTNSSGEVTNTKVKY